MKNLIFHAGSKFNTNKLSDFIDFNFCDFIPQTTQPRSDEMECVTFIAHNETKDFSIFIEQLKKELGIDVQYKYEWGLKN